jgi:hypothetical protein
LIAFGASGAIEPLGAELGIWHGKVDNHKLPWLRWWDSNGGLLLTGEDRANAAKYRAEREKHHAINDLIGWIKTCTYKLEL